MKFRPLQDWAVVQRINAEEKTSGGIIVPDSAKEKPSEGIIVAIGPGRFKPDKKDKKKKIFEPTTLKPGQRVIFAQYMVTEVELEGEEITLVREEDILGTIEGSTDVAVKPSYEIKEKTAQAVMVKGRSEIAPAPGKAREEVTPSAAVPKKKAAPKKAAPPAGKKKAAVKKKGGKAVPKKTKKAAKKMLKKAAPKKKTAKKAKAAKKTVKKAAPKKKTVKKAVKKKALKKGTAKAKKKTTVKKTTSKKKKKR